MNRSQRGVVLFSTLLMIAVISLLVLSLMQAVLLYMKTCNQLIHQHDVLHEMESVIQRLDLARSDCVVHQKTPNELIDQMVAHQGCTHTEKDRVYTYIIGDLGPYPCLPIETPNGLQGSRHWLITIATASLPNTLLQVRLSMPEKTQACLRSAPHPIHAGVLSFRKVLLK